MRIVTYNVHSCRGSDGRTSPERVARTLQQLKPRVVALQEVGSLAVAEFLAGRLGMDLFFVAARTRDQQTFGNAVMSDVPAVLVHDGPLPRLGPSTEARAAQWVRLVTTWGALDVFNTHLGLKPAERQLQVEALLGPDWLGHPDTSPYAVFCGDFNARPGSKAYNRIRLLLHDAQRDVGRRVRTFPSVFPVVRIDHVFLSPQLVTTAVKVPSNTIARFASDHRPLAVDVRPAGSVG